MTTSTTISDSIEDDPIGLEPQTAEGPAHGAGVLSTAVHPVVPGLHPDPTVCRVGDDYYLAHSSFEYSPGVPVWHSIDLLHWTLLGNALEREDQLPAGYAHASGGVYAPTLRHHDGRFWLITTDVSTSGQLVVSADDAAGPWSSALALPGVRGIDPDLAWDEQGRCWVTYCSTDPDLVGIAQVEVDLVSGATLTDPRTVWTGTGLAFPEAPHLYEVNGWWYLVIAEGGTERGHAVTVARSLQPSGPFTPSPRNPLLSHRSTTHPVQNTGHADLVELVDGSWAMVYLGVRPRGMTPMFHVIGRETFLAGVDWRDGWPVVDEDRFYRRPRPTSFTEDFTAPALHPRWVSPGAAPRSFASRAATGGVGLSAGSAANGAPDALVTRVTDLRWRIEAALDMSSDSAALLLRLDDRHWYEVRAHDGVASAIARIGPLESTIAEVEIGERAGLTLRMETTASETAGPDDILLSVALPGHVLALARLDGRYLSTEVAGGFTGRVVGMRAITGTAVFTRFRYEGMDLAARATDA